MFDVAFSELIVIAVVALIVIGPERLPKVARTLGALTGRMQRYVAQVKDEVNREVRFQELQQLQEEIKATATATQAKMGRLEADMRDEVQRVSNPNNIDNLTNDANAITNEASAENVSVEKR